jgi:hypothetical protein
MWTTLRKLLKKEVNTEYLNPDGCLSYFATLFTNNHDGISLKKAQIFFCCDIPNVVNQYDASNWRLFTDFKNEFKAVFGNNFCFGTNRILNPSQGNLRDQIP